MKECNFKIHKRKISTGRVVVWNKLGITNSYTLESSFLGFSISNNSETTPFTLEHYFEIGEQLAKSLLVYSKIMKDLSLELKINGGWLKPVILNQVTGTPLRDIKMQEIEEEERK